MPRDAASVGVVALVLGGLCGLMACGSADEPSAVTTGPIEPEADPSAPTASAPATATTTGQPADTDPLLPVGATVEEIVAASQPVLGPTDDITAELAPFVPLPANVPTPANADIFGFRTVTYHYDEDTVLHMSNVDVYSSGTPEDIADFYTARLTAAGFTAAGSGTVEGTYDIIETLTFEIPDRPDRPDGLYTVEIKTYQPTPAATDPRPWLRVTVTDHAPAQALERLGSWANPIPGYGSVELDSAEVSTTALTAGSGVHLDAGVLVPGDEDEVLSTIRSRLPSEVYRKSPEPPPFEFNLPVRRAGFDSIEIEERGRYRSTDDTLVDVRGDVRFPRSAGAATTLVPTSTAPAPTTPATTEPPATMPPVRAMPLLRDGAEADEIVTAARGVLGPTDDLVADLAPFVRLPANLPTPIDTDIVDFNVTLFPDTYTATVFLRTGASLADVATYYEAKLVAAGYVLENDGEGVDPDDRGHSVRTLDFAFGPGEGEFSITDGVHLRLVTSNATGEEWVELQVGNDTARSTTGIIDAWPGEVPGLALGDTTIATVGTKTINEPAPADAMRPDDPVYLSASYVVGRPESPVLDLVRAAIPTGTYAIEPRERPCESGPCVRAKRQGFDSIRFYEGISTGDDAVVSVHGRTTGAGR